MASTLVCSELLKYKHRVEKLVAKFKTKSSFVLVNGGSVVLSNTPANNSIMARLSFATNYMDQEFLKFVRGITLDTDHATIKTVKLSDLKKTTEFGGGTDPNKRENDQLGELQATLAEIMTKTNSPFVEVKLRNTVYTVSEVRKSPRISGLDPKADFEFIEYNKDGVVKPVFWISHKDGNDPRSFAQYSGISRKVEPRIWSRPETQAFIKDVKKKFPGGVGTEFSRGNPVWRAVTYVSGLPISVYKEIFHAQSDANLIQNIAVYGNDYGFGGNYGPQNVNAVMQGKISLHFMSGVRYSLVASASTHYNGDLMAQGYQPVFAAWNDASRSDQGLPFTRFGIRAFGQVKVDATHIV